MSQHRTPGLEALVLFSLLLTSALFLALPLLPSLGAAHLENPPQPTIVVTRGDPVRADTNSSIAITVTNPAKDPYGITSLAVYPPGGWNLTSCAGGLPFTCQSASSVAFYSTGRNGPLAPGASATLVFSIIPPTASCPQCGYPFYNLFETSKIGYTGIDASYAGPPFNVTVMATSTRITLSPAADANYTVGGPPIEITAKVTPAQAGLPIVFTAPGYGAGVIPGFSAATGSTNASGFATTFFAPSDRSGDSTNVTATIGTSRISGASGMVTTLARSITTTSTTRDSTASTAPPPNFDLTVGPASQTVGPGQAFNETISITSVNTTSGMVVALSVTGPAGTDLPAAVPSSGRSPFVAALKGVAPVAPGHYAFTVTGTFAGRVTHGAGFMVIVPPPSLVLSPASGAKGSTITVKGSDFPPGSDISITMGKLALGTAVSTSQGAFSVPVKVPEIASGNYTVVATGRGGVPADRPFAVLAAPPPPPPVLPVTLVAEIAIVSFIAAGSLGGAWAVHQSRSPPRPNNVRFTVKVKVATYPKKKQEEEHRS